VKGLEIEEGIATDHARGRIRQRIKVPKRATDRAVKLALKRGHPPTSYTGAMRKYLDKISQKTLHYGKNSMLIVYAKSLYIFTGTETPVLITVWRLPKRFRDVRPKGMEE